MPLNRKRQNERRVGLTPSQRVRDRKLAEKAVGRKLKRTELVHHFSLTQLVVCQDDAYHKLLHFLEDGDGEWETEQLAKIERRIDCMKIIIERMRPGLVAQLGPLIDAGDKEALLLALATDGSWTR